jgi:hypothetical protein
VCGEEKVHQSSLLEGRYIYIRSGWAEGTGRGREKAEAVNGREEE